MFNMFDVVRMGFDELKKAVKSGAKKANERARKLFKKEGLFSTPALTRAKKSKERGQTSLFSVKGKNRNQLLKEYKRIKNFMEDETSTITGTKKFYEKAAEKISTDGSTISADKVANVFKVFDKLSDESPWVSNQRFKYKVFEAIDQQIEPDQMSEEDIDNIVNGLEDVIEKIYRDEMDDEDFIDVNDFLE